MRIFKNDENTIPDKIVPEFLETSEDSLYLEDNKRIEDINNTHRRERKKVVDKTEQKLKEKLKCRE